jgi:hypothetical protein
MKAIRLATMVALVFGVSASSIFAQDVGERDTCRYEPTSTVWTIDNPSDSIFTVSLWGWIDDSNVIGASFGFKVSSYGGSDWTPLIDSMISVDTFVYDPGLDLEVEEFRRTVVDTSLYPFGTDTDYLGYNGYLIGLLNIFPILPIFEPEISTRIGEVWIRLREPEQLPPSFSLNIDSLYFPPAGYFLYSPVGGLGYTPYFLNCNIDVINNLASGVEAVLEPDPVFIYYKFAVDPLGASAYVGNFDTPYDASSVDLTTLLINGTIVPTSSSVIPSHTGFSGEVVEMNFPISDFIDPYGVPHDTTSQQFQVTGMFNDSTPFTRTGDFTLVGKSSQNPKLWIIPDGEIVVPCDVVPDGFVDLDDIMRLVGYVFHGAEIPGSIDRADCNCSGFPDVDDLVYLLNYVFIDGPAPCSE